MTRLKLQKPLNACFALFLTVGLPISVNAETNYPGETPAFRKCMDAVDLGALKNTQWLDCYVNELKAQDLVLNDVYRNLQTRLPRESKQSLAKAQLAWLNYRASWCQYEQSLPMAPSADVNYQACLLELTLVQIRHINDSYN